MVKKIIEKVLIQAGTGSHHSGRTASPSDFNTVRCQGGKPNELATISSTHPPHPLK